MGCAWRREARATARARGRPLRGACRGILFALHSRSREDADRRRARSARGGRFPALLRVRGPAPVHQAAAASGADRGAERAAFAWPRGDRLPFRRGISRSPSSPGLVVGAAGGGQCGDRQAGRANAADRRAGDRADARGGHSQGRGPARARLGPDRRRSADGASAAGRRRLHRLDRDGADDQPHAGRARTGRSSRSSPKPAVRMR